MKKKTSKMQPKVSIIVPIYNVEQYLNECIDSIINQTIKEIEVILVDDGSPDRCGEIIDEYAKKDGRVIAIHQKNSGYSSAVNKGIDLASGEYIGIIESDDFVEPDMYETLYRNAKYNNTDVTKGMFFFYNPTAPEGSRDKIYSSSKDIDLMLAPDGAFRAAEWPRIVAFHASIWSSIYRSDFIKKIKIPQSAGASYQDFPFMVDVMCKAKRISVVKKPFVHWRNEPKQGNSTSARGKKLLLMAKNTKAGLENLKKSGYYDELKEAFFVHAFWTNINFFFRIERRYKKIYFEKLKDIFSSIRNDADFKYEYFRPEDRYSMWILLRCNNYRLFELSYIMGGIKRKIKKTLTKDR